MSIRVYNDMTRQKEEFVPLHPGKVGIYVCGVTPYNHPHIGNARPFVVWDTIRRFLDHEGYDVTYVQNFTDVDDKIIRAANEEGVTWDVIANRYIKAYFEVMDKLHVKRAHIYPRVSEHIPDIIHTVQELINNGYGYVVDGDVYYRVERFSHYGELSGRKLDDMMAGARVDVDERKENPMDFALWKSAKPGEPSWDSPWGKGRPGWHIECSTMSTKYLGQRFDIHGGGMDLFLYTGLNITLGIADLDIALMGGHAYEFISVYRRVRIWPLREEFHFCHYSSPPLTASSLGQINELMNSVSFSDKPYLAYSFSSSHDSLKS